MSAAHNAAPTAFVKAKISEANGTILHGDLKLAVISAAGRPSERSKRASLEEPRLYGRPLTTNPITRLTENLLKQE